jgi:hypothetical protein
MKHYFFVGFKLLSCYLLGGAAYIFYIQWPNLDGHAHVPFSGFPATMVMAPLAPYFIVSDLMETTSHSTFGTLVYLVSFGVAFWFFFNWRKPNSRP